MMKKRLFFSFVFFAKVALATVLPLVVFVVPGRIIDKKLSISPALTIISVLLALASTTLSLRLISKKTAKKYRGLN